MEQKRFEAIAQAIAEDESFAKKLFDMSPEDAAIEFSKKGYDFTADELITFGEECKKFADKNGELNDGDLDNVAGGVVISGAVLTAGVTLFLSGCGAGYLISSRW